MKKILYLVLAILIAFPTLGFAREKKERKRGLKQLEVVETVEVNAPPAVVWDKIKDFNGLPGWHPAFKNSRLDEANKSIRILTLQSGGQIIEKQISYDENNMSYTYSIEKADYRDVPVANYTATLHVRPGRGGGSIVEWRGVFNPPPGMSAKESLKFVKNVYTTGLQNLKKILEERR
ncbi:MAG TPA: SRPBCC family protein [Candidatus Limnocylindrales bacterium]|nr:SRPBCC family protein [Candidatus Limnocylindrales bacterium]